MERSNSNKDTISGKYQLLLGSLTPLYGEVEAKSVTRIVFEDAFGIFDFQDKSLFPSQHEARFLEIQTRLLKNEPVQYVLGEGDFYGLKFEVNPSVLIPRQETEELVYWVLETLEKEDLKGKRLLDVGSGSGCIPILLKKKRPELEVVSVDISAEALEVARRNAARHQVHVDWRELDFLDTNTWPALGSFDLLISNPPYIDPSEEPIMPPHVLEFEPNQALFTGNSPIEFYQAIAEFSKKHLFPGGNIFAECNEFRLVEVIQTFEKEGYTRLETRKDMDGKLRMIRALADFP